MMYDITKRHMVISRARERERERDVCGQQYTLPIQRPLSLLISPSLSLPPSLVSRSTPRSLPLPLVLSRSLVEVCGARTPSRRRTALSWRARRGRPRRPSWRAAGRPLRQKPPAPPCTTPRATRRRGAFRDLWLEVPFSLACSLSLSALSLSSLSLSGSLSLSRSLALCDIRSDVISII